MQKLRQSYLVALLAVLALAMLPFSKLGISVSHPWDKINHIAAFFALGLVAFFIYPNKKIRILFALTLIGIAIESIQFHLASRSASFGDVVANSFGLLFALIFFGSIQITGNIVRYLRSLVRR